MTDKEAMAKLDELVAQHGTLKIITAVEAPDRTTDDPRDPAFQVLEDVDAIERQINQMLLVAVGRNGSLTIGQPLALLIKLLEWKYYDPERPAATRERVLAALA